jgi:hypothetical protein
MDGISNVWYAAKDDIEKKLYPFTITHIISFIIITAITIYITEFFLRHTLIRWIYVSSIIVILVDVYNGKKRTTVE